MHTQLTQTRTCLKVFQMSLVQWKYMSSKTKETSKKGNRKVHGVPQSQSAALPGHQEEEKQN